jgi:hypothetical protein
MPPLHPTVPEFARLAIPQGPSSFRVGAIGALAGAAAAVLIGLAFQWLWAPSEDPLPEYLLRRELEEHLRHSDGLFRQLMYCKGADPKRELELLGAELKHTAFASRTRRLGREFETGVEGTYLKICETVVRGVDIELRKQDDPAGRLARIRALVADSRLFDSIGIVTLRLATDGVSSGSDDAALFVAARRAYFQGRYAAAFRHLEALLERFPRSGYRTDAIYWMGTCAEQLGRGDLAGELYNFIPDALWFEKRTW